MILQTASEGITFTKELENNSSSFYTSLAQRYPKDADIFYSFVKEDKKNIAMIERTYYGVISDAIEGCFAFSIDPSNYTFAITLPDGASYHEILNQAIQMEEKIVKFYLDAANQSRNLMADIPRVFMVVARKREEHIAKLKLLFKDGR